MTDSFEDHEGADSMGYRTVTSLSFVDDIDGIAGEEEELAKLAEYPNKASTACSMEIGAKKTTLVTVNTKSYQQSDQRTWTDA